MFVLEVSQSTAVGILYFFMSVITLPLQLILIKILMTQKEFRNLTAYRIMAHMSMCDCILVIGTFMGAIMSIGETNYHVYVERVGGSFITAGWIGITFLSLLLALNRFLLFVGFKFNCLSEKVLYTIGLGITWFSSVSLFVIHLIPTAALTYNIKFNAYTFTNDDLSRLFEHIEYLCIFSTLIVIFVLCIATVVAIIVQRNLHTSKFKLAASEVKLFVQSVLIFLYLSTIRCMWHFGRALLYSNVVFVSLAVATQAVCSLNPLLYLIFNKAIREHFLGTLGLGKMKITSVKTKSQKTTSHKMGSNTI
ncbi:hypothetical protein QR680_010154 [Steinernema hermaphroditum]|uniref:G-protein coupled receptors family 1 profile domain-containing protein n=1 Tax=Steinernema hermaphroditum TaxID=289476 RepID=A0AA39IMY6_9BILA|nr:hypothetical protein QR680_010154 [Steinernema hermaphroditum]